MVTHPYSIAVTSLAHSATSPLSLNITFEMFDIPKIENKCGHTPDICAIAKVFFLRRNRTLAHTSPPSHLRKSETKY